MTQAEYIANVRARFGDLPSFDELAKLESMAYRANLNQSPMARAQHPEQQARAKAAIQRRITKRAEANLQAVLASLTKEATLADIVRATGLPKTTAQKVLARALDDGLVTWAVWKGCAIWERNTA
jgi:Fic family protein